MKNKKFSFRKWFFKLLTGYDLIEWHEILNLAADVNKEAKEVNDHAQSILALASRVNNHAKEVIELMKEITEGSNEES